MALLVSGSAFQRARALTSHAVWQVVLLGIVLALFPPLLLVLLGLVLAVMVNPQVENPWVFSRMLSATGSDLLSDEQRPVALIWLIGLGVAVALGQALVGHWYRRAIYRLGRQAATELKRRLHAQVFRLGTQDSLGEERAWPEELLLDQTDVVRRGIISWYRAVPQSVVLLALLWALAFVIHFWLALLTVILAALMWRLDGWLREWSGRASHRHRQHAEMADQLLAEAMRLAPLATGYAMTTSPAGPVADWLRQQEQEGYRADLATARSPWYWMVVLWCIAFWLMIVALAQDATLPGSIVLATAIVGSWFPLQRLRRWRSSWTEYERAAREIFAYLDREPPVRELPGAEPLGRVQREIRFDNVTVVDRHGTKLLHEVSCAVPAHALVALVASNPRVLRGLVELLPRLVDPTSGRVLFDDHDLRFVTIASARQQTLLVLRDALVFTGTVRDNITCGDESFTTDQIHEAAKQAQAIDFVLQLPDNFETVIGEHGHRLGPWQAFRIALARAIIRDPSVLVIEEPVEDLTESERGAVDLALQQARQGRTVLMLTRRLPVLRSADAVLLLHDGQLVGHAKHLELLEQSELYRHLNYMWFNPFPHIR